MSTSFPCCRPVKKNTKQKNFSDLIALNHNETVKTIDRLHEILTDLRYEGEYLLGKNLNKVVEVLEFLKNELIWRIDVEEDVLFPFLKSHLPRLESVIALFRSEHRDFRRSLDEIQGLMARLKRGRDLRKQRRAIEAIVETGMYLTYLVRNHVLAEEESIYKVIDLELKLDEKRKLTHRIRMRRKTEK